MKRLAVVLAAVLPLSGCFWGECSRTVTVDWTSFRLADNTVTSSCQAAGVSTIDVWVNSAFAGAFACTGPAAGVRLGSGSNLVTVEGRDAGGVIRYRDEFTVDGGHCGDVGVVEAQPGEGRISVSYTFAPVNACFDPGPSFIWVYVLDDIANEVAADSSAAPESGNVCGVNFPFTFRVAAGEYTLLRTQEMIRSGGGYATVARDCTPYALQVSPAATTPVSAVLADASVSCP